MERVNTTKRTAIMKFLKRVKGWLSITTCRNCANARYNICPRHLASEAGARIGA